MLLCIGLNYLTSTTAPASCNCFLIDSASSLVTPVFTSLGAPSTKSLASFKPRPVKSFTNLTTANLAPPASFRITSNAVCTAQQLGHHRHLQQQEQQQQQLQQQVQYHT